MAATRHSKISALKQCQTFSCTNSNLERKRPGSEVLPIFESAHQSAGGRVSQEMLMLLDLRQSSKISEYHRALYGTMNLVGSKGLGQRCPSSKLAV